MGQQLPPRELELYKRCDEVLHYIWDPIGVAGAPPARDEYYGYLPAVYAMVRDDHDERDIIAHLNSIVRDRMGLEPRARDTEEAVSSMISWKEWIWQQDGPQWSD